MRARRAPALLALEDGTVFRGAAFGAPVTVTGEVCFNTGMTGYQEILTDPSYHGQIVTMTAPQVGNTGVNEFDDQSRHPWVSAFVVREVSETFSSWRATGSLDGYLAGHGIPGISEVDTRRLTRHIRTAGAMQGAVSSEIMDADELIDMARAAPGLVGRDLAREVTVEQPYDWNVELLAARAEHGYAAGREREHSTSALLAERTGETHRIAAYDYGLKQNILDLLVASGSDVTVLPATTPARDVLDARYDGVFLSNGPGDPEPVEYAVEAVAELLGKIPVFGICLGHQILGLALGARTFKLPFGHRGGNHPVKRTDHPRVEITCQNHGFAVDPDSVEHTTARLTHINLNDSTVEGLAVDGAAFSVQYHPESGPGPHDSRYLFEQFHNLIDRFEPSTPARGRERDGTRR